MTEGENSFDFKAKATENDTPKQLDVADELFDAELIAGGADSPAH